jgi:hypothetical protein
MPRVLLMALTALAVLALASCGGGSEREESVLQAESEGLYLDIQEMTYQIQISRQLNAADTEDQAYLQGVDPAERRLRPDESWFAVFLRVDNLSDEPQRAAEEFEVTDTQENRYTPVPIAASNPFAYKGGTVPPGEQLPPLSSLAQQNESVNGALILFKVRNFSFENRPLEFLIQDPVDPDVEGSVLLDV